MNDIYMLIGEIIEIVQYIEHNLACIASKNGNSTKDDIFYKMQNMTLGEEIFEIIKSDKLGDNDIDELKDILNDRNKIVHQFFKENDFEKHDKSFAFLENKKGYLKNRLQEMTNMNNRLCKLIDRF